MLLDLDGFKGGMMVSCCESVQCKLHRCVLTEFLFFCRTTPAGCSVNYTAAYESNLVNLIQDLRYALRKPNLPVVIGVSGFDGWDNRVQRRIDIMSSQLAAANLTKHPELVCGVSAIETRDYWRPAKFSPMDQEYHFHHNAETHYLIGKAMAKGMNKLQNGPGGGKNCGFRVAASRQL